ncbi:pilus assembly protein [Actinomadura sp. NAK00032]|uniref:TadE family type IV pilus minor pilin n=1 Tax=Actinomadura sp. NAK00032 TaxID=2742128 RepID=UPI001591F7E2|nr:TadE family type IV pilus minor pilin [Actinomadura sp. NAK00032]QKW39890.1 pilus assembly protein [Actinomadura sp. NAK00032]
MATAEIAVALPALVLITAAALWGLMAVSVQLTCTDAARTGARAAARGESLTAVRELVVKMVPAGAAVRVHRDEATVHVDVSVPVRPPAAIGLPPLTAHAHVAAATEPGVGRDTDSRPAHQPGRASAPTPPPG